MRLLKNAYEQNLARCIGAPQGADFYSYLIPDLLGISWNASRTPVAVTAQVDLGSATAYHNIKILLRAITDPRSNRKSPKLSRS